jgi:hypothetical protein
MQVVLDERDESGEERVLLLSVVPGQSDHLMLVEESVSERLHNTPEDTKTSLHNENSLCKEIIVLFANYSEQ